MRPIIFLALCLIAHSCFGQTVVVKPFEAIEAKSVQVEQLTDTVAVMLEDPKPGVRTGAYLTVGSDYKWAIPSYDGLEFKATARPGEWITFAPSGKYRILLGEFDPERGPRLTYHDLVIPGNVEPPPPPPPPAGDMMSLTKVAREAADKVGDPPTRAALASAYKAALTTSAGKPYDDARVSVTAARFAVLNARKGDSLKADWNTWLKAVDTELVKVAPAGDAAKYAAAIEAIVKGLE